MDVSLLFMILAGVTVAALIVGVNMLIAGGGGGGDAIKTRLAKSIDNKSDKAGKGKGGIPTLLKAPTINGQALWSKLLPNSKNISLLYEQANVPFEFSKFMMIVAGASSFPVIMFMMTTAIGIRAIPFIAVPIASVTFAGIPFMWLNFRKHRRIHKFVAAMPEALELSGRALRAGHGLASGLKMVADEMTGPIADEFGRVFEEQNLGIPLEDALRAMSERVPVMDVRFFVTAVVIQRSVGGDLGEVLDKISRIIRQRFEIKGQVAALTGEGRLSGAVLLAMPPALLGYLFLTNRDYVIPLFTEPELGQPMLIGATVFQILGALAIKKIVNIKV